VTPDAARADAEGHGRATLCSEEASGLTVREVVPVRMLGDGLVEVLRSPGIVTGCAAGDVVRIVDEDGRFIVTHRGPNECVQAYGSPQFTLKAIDVLSVLFERAGGMVEAPAHRAYLVVTVPTSVGRAWITDRMTEWCADFEATSWRFGT